jgi:protein PsiE
MVASFYKNQQIPIAIPIFIAITALSRLIILQGKETSALNLIYESGAVLLLALAAVILAWSRTRERKAVAHDKEDS